MSWKPWSRRDFVTTSTVAAVSMVVRVHPRLAHAQPWLTRRIPPGGDALRDPRVKALLLQAVDAARSAGAQYADVRATYTKSITHTGALGVGLRENLGLSVRALVNGYWGFAATPTISPDEGLRIGQEAVALAKSLGAAGRPRAIDWHPIPVVSDGDWTTPIQEDPFNVAYGEITDLHFGMGEYVSHYRPGAFLKKFEMSFDKEDSAFASSDGSYITQTRYWTGGEFNIGGLKLDTFSQVQGGFEYVRGQSFRAKVAEMIEQLREDAAIPVKSTYELGRFDIVFDQVSVGELLSKTLAPATQLDRALGYEANASGTSYLGPDPHTFLGTAIASPLVTLTADRSSAHGMNTTKWDSEGVSPDDFTLIHRGVLADYQTTREQASWLTEWYGSQKHSVHSHGCAMSPSALDIPMQHTPNLTLAPGAQDQHLALDLEKGYWVQGGGGISVDQQCLNGQFVFDWLNGTKVYEVKGGKVVARLNDVSAAIAFRSPELWRNILTVGGPQSVRTYPVGLSSKGDPRQFVEYSITTVPILAKQLALIDPTRKA